MSGVWNTATLDIALPSNGRLVPGSGTVYIGGPRLPSELKSVGSQGAIVFYGNAGDNLAKYYYLAYAGDNFGGYFIRIGYCNLTGQLIDMFKGASYQPGRPGNTSLTGNAGPGETPASLALDVQIRAFTYNGYITLETGSFVAGVGARSIFLKPAVTGEVVAKVGMGGNINYANAGLKLSNLNSARPYIKSNGTPFANTDLDYWITASSVQNIGGVPCTVDVEWKMTPDYVVELRYKITVTSGTMPNANLNCTLPGNYPNPTGSDPYGFGLRELCRVAGASNGFAPNLFTGTTLFIDYTNTTVAGTGGTAFYGQFIYLAEKV